MYKFWKLFILCELKNLNWKHEKIWRPMLWILRCSSWNPKVKRRKDLKVDAVNFVFYVPAHNMFTALDDKFNYEGLSWTSQLVSHHAICYFLKKQCTETDKLNPIWHLILFNFFTSRISMYINNLKEPIIHSNFLHEWVFSIV